MALKEDDLELKDRATHWNDPPKRFTKLPEIAAPIVDQYQRIIKRLGITREGNACFRLTLTSCCHGEGVTTVAYQLAIVAARLQNRVLLVEANPTRPQLTHVFGLEHNRGLAELLTEGDRFTTAHPTESRNLFVMPLGSLPLKAIGRRELDELFGPLVQEFDLILIDAPPVFDGFSNLLWLTAWQPLLMVLANNTAKETLDAGKQKIQALGLEPMGLIRNQIEF